MGNSVNHHLGCTMYINLSVIVLSLWIPDVNQKVVSAKAMLNASFSFNTNLFVLIFKNIIRILEEKKINDKLLCACPIMISKITPSIDQKF